VKAIKPEIITCKISCILTSNDDGGYDVASNALSSLTIMQGIKIYIVQYDMTLIIMITKSVSLLFTPASITSAMVWLNAIDDYETLKDNHYAVWQEFISPCGSDVEIESDAWLEGTLHLSTESSLQAKVESDFKSLSMNQCGALTMLCFIIKCMVICNQELGMPFKKPSRCLTLVTFPGRMSYLLASN
jgi:hypothetical protein